MYKFSAIYLVNKNHAYFIECLTTDIIYPNLSGPNLVQCTGQGATTYRKYWARIGQVRTTPAEPELQIIGIHVPLKGYISSSDFYYFWHWGGIRLGTLTLNFTVVALKMWAHSPSITITCIGLNFLVFEKIAF